MHSGDHHGDDQGASQPVTYAVTGDTPYGTAAGRELPNDVSEINADLQVRLVMHLGDIKNGSSQCSTRYFEQIRADFNQFDDPMVFTPGDQRMDRLPPRQQRRLLAGRSRC